MDFLQLHDEGLKSRTTIIRQLNKMVQKNQITKSHPESKRYPVYSNPKNLPTDFEIKESTDEELEVQEQTIEVLENVFLLKQGCEI